MSSNPLVNILSDLVWGTGNPVVDRYHSDWTTAAGSAAEQPARVSQSEEAFIRDLAAMTPLELRRPPSPPAAADAEDPVSAVAAYRRSR